MCRNPVHTYPATQRGRYRQRSRHEAALDLQLRELAPVTIIFQFVGRPISTKYREEMWPDLVLLMTSP